MYVLLRQYMQIYIETTQNFSMLHQIISQRYAAVVHVRYVQCIGNNIQVNRHYQQLNFDEQPYTEHWITATRTCIFSFWAIIIKLLVSPLPTDLLKMVPTQKFSLVFKLFIFSTTFFITIWIINIDITILKNEKKIQEPTHLPYFLTKETDIFLNVALCVQIVPSFHQGLIEGLHLNKCSTKTTLILNLYTIGSTLDRSLVYLHIINRLGTTRHLRNSYSFE